MGLLSCSPFLLRKIFQKFVAVEGGIAIIFGFAPSSLNLNVPAPINFGKIFDIAPSTLKFFREIFQKFTGKIFPKIFYKFQNGTKKFLEIFQEKFPENLCLKKLQKLKSFSTYKRIKKTYKYYLYILFIRITYKFLLYIYLFKKRKVLGWAIFAKREALQSKQPPGTSTNYNSNNL